MTHQEEMADRVLSAQRRKDFTPSGDARANAASREAVANAASGEAVANAASGEAVADPATSAPVGLLDRETDAFAREREAAEYYGLTDREDEDAYDSS